MVFSFPAAHSEGQENLILSRKMDVVFAGRRYGKTFLGCQRIIQACMEDPGLYFWVGLGWRSASLKRAWRELKATCRIMWEGIGEKADRHIRESSKELDFPGGGEIWLRTAERQDSIAGEGIKGAVMDEFTLMQESVWLEFLEATLLDHGGWCMFTGVPKGANWGAKLWKNCETPPTDHVGSWSGSRPGWVAHHFATGDNPKISKARLEDIKKNTPSILYQQEYEAKVVDHAGLVFHNIDTCLGGTPLFAGLDGHTYVFGLDWGKTNDFTCISIIDVDTKELVSLIRFNDIDYPEQLKRVSQAYRLFQPRNIIAESNAMGEPLCDQLIKDGMPISKFYTTNASKREIIESLQVAFEQRYIKMINDPDLINELESFESEVTTMGNVRYSAPAGGHDDCVISLALAWSEVRYDLGISL